MEELILLIQKTYGLVGIFMMLPIGGCWLLWRENLRIHKELKEAADATMAAQAQRVADAQSISGKLLEITREQSALNTETNLVLGRINSTLDRIHEDRWLSSDKSRR